MIRLWFGMIISMVLVSLLGCGGGDSGQGPSTRPSVKSTASKEPERSYVTNSIGMKLVLIPKGKFMMGSPKGEAPTKEQEKETQHEVEITRSFFLGVHEVTQKQFQEVMGTNPSYFAPEGKGKNTVAAIDTSKLPVENVTWEEAEEFCTKLSALPAEKTAGRVYQLPTEAEWEYACRAGANPQTAFHTGKTLASTDANFDRQFRRTREGGYYKPNAFGLYDMHGNVLEWCADWLGPYTSEPAVDPTGPTTGRYRVYRGGGFLGTIEMCRSAQRYAATTQYRMVDVGIRVKMLADQK